VRGLRGKVKFFSVMGLVFLALTTLMLCDLMFHHLMCDDFMRKEGESTSTGEMREMGDGPRAPEYTYRKDKDFQRVAPLGGDIPPFAEIILCPSIVGANERFLRGKGMVSVTFNQGGRASHAVSSVAEFLKFHTDSIGTSRLHAQIVQRK
jgi:hypothetical protein